MSERTRTSSRDRTHTKQINDAVKDKPPGLAITTHLCRGNYRSSWAASGGYDFVAEALFSELDVDGPLRVSAEAIELRARAGQLTLDASDDVVVCGETIQLN